MVFLLKVVDIFFMIAKQNFVIMYYLWYHLQNQVAMKEYAKKPKSQSRTLDSNPKASGQAPFDEILQQYKRNIQRYASVEEGESLQVKFDTAQQEDIDEDELLQKEFESAPTSLQEPILQEKPNNTGLPDNLKTGIENLSGYSMDDVNVHYNSDKPAQLNALAYAQGTDIHIAPGQEKHLPHETWHVVQQKQGRVQPTMQLQGVNVNDNEGLEKEADMMGGQALCYSNRNNINKRLDISQFYGGTLIDVHENNKKGEAVQRQNVIQRIIVVAQTELDFGMIVNVYQMLINNIDRRVTLLHLLGQTGIKGEQIGLQGHGYGKQGKYARLEASQLAAILKKAGVDESNKVIDLLSCSSGSGGEKSYAEEFAKAMDSSSTIIANRGLGVTMDDGYVYSKRSRTPDEQKEYDKIFVDCEAQLNEAQAVAESGQAEITKAQTEEDVKNFFMIYGKMILDVAGDLFRRLYEHQRKLLAFHNDPNSGLYVSPPKKTE